MTRTSVAIIGVGKIARDQHIPALLTSDRFTLVATVSRSGGVHGVETFTDVDELLTARPDIVALSLCMPPQPRFDIAKKAILAGKHTMLEKPAGATVSEALSLSQLAKDQNVTVFATWHSRYAAGVAQAKAWLSDKRLLSASIVWKEDVRRWHPGQDWIWHNGGFGVFDPGINALSILTEIIAEPVHLTAATLSVPENRATPIAAELEFIDAGGARILADFDWRHEGPQTWNITVQTDAGELRLSDGGATLNINDKKQKLQTSGEYPGLYARFADLIAAGQSDMDLRPLQHVADAFMIGRRITVAAFHD